MRFNQREFILTLRVSPNHLDFHVSLIRVSLSQVYLDPLSKLTPSFAEPHLSKKVEGPIRPLETVHKTI